MLNATHLCYLDFVPHSPFGLASVGVSAHTDRKTGVLSVCSERWQTQTIMLLGAFGISDNAFIAMHER